MLLRRFTVYDWDRRPRLKAGIDTTMGHVGWFARFVAGFDLTFKKTTGSTSDTMININPLTEILNLPSLENERF